MPAMEKAEAAPVVTPTLETAAAAPVAIPPLEKSEAAPVVAETVSQPVAEEPVPAPPAQYTPYSQKDKDELMNLLLSQSREDSRLSAARNLLALWGKHPPLTKADADSFYSLAMNQQMRCTEFWTTLDSLRRYNSPCVLEMFVPQQTNLRYAVLKELGPSDATILFGDSVSMRLPLELLDEFWMRRAYIFWRDFEPLDEIIQLGDRSAGVVWLQASLQFLGYYSGELTGIFDMKTQKAVRDFQQKNYLMLDGIVGPRTRLALYGQLARYSMPRLKRGSI
jgi:hypothetical protein